MSVYPRWRGEHTVSRRSRVSLVGLSPLARGTPVNVAAHDSSGRFIPAGAGNTKNH
ncbi:hypothetical protein NAL19_387 [Pectobacterium sp. F1-1]|nr:hypothetical protein NAL19_387 [Pectobacterium sp. F1-1]